MRNVFTAKLMLFVLVVGHSLPDMALAQSTQNEVVEAPALVEQWYGALGSVNRQGFEELIADDAKIVLRDLGVEQSKLEFIAALDEWEASTRDASIVYRYETIEAGKASVLVCYRFKSNEQLNLESFTFSDMKITGSVQEFKGEDCGDM